ncbi:MAG: site-specific integrase [Novosphingobium sp.]|nr:site-specific integrase [Novosphingobium sp.]
MSNTVTAGSCGFGTARAGLYGADGSRKYLNAAERARVFAAIERLEPRKALFLLMLSWTGGRVSEILAVTPMSFQVEQSVASLITLKRRRLVVREVPLPPKLTRSLEEFFDLRAAQRDQEAAQRRLWQWRRETAWKLVKRVMAEADVRGRPACPRGMRHGFAVNSLQAGVPINLVQRWMGHARMETTAIYAEVCGPEERAFAERIWMTG